MSDKIERIKKVGKKLKPQRPVQEPNKDYFDQLMRQRRVEVEPPTNEAATKNVKEAGSIFDEVRELNKKTNYLTHSSSEELAKQSEDVIAQIDELKHKLETPNLEIKTSVQNVLRSKIQHIDNSLKIALSKAGLEYTPPERPTSLQTPVERFLGLLTHSQNSLETLAGDVQAMYGGRKEFNPANMLLIQIKVAQVQQEIELFTSMLNKALESTKTIMNVQV